MASSYIQQSTPEAKRGGVELPVNPHVQALAIRLRPVTASADQTTARAKQCPDSDRAEYVPRSPLATTSVQVS